MQNCLLSIIQAIYFSFTPNFVPKSVPATWKKIPEGTKMLVLSRIAYTGMEWESEPGNVTLKINQNGHISGGGTQHPQHFRFEGTLTEGHLELEVEIEVMEETSGGYPSYCAIWR